MARRLAMQCRLYAMSILDPTSRLRYHDCTRRLGTKQNTAEHEERKRRGKRRGILFTAWKTHGYLYHTAVDAWGSLLYWRCVYGVFGAHELGISRRKLYMWQWGLNRVSLMCSGLDMAFLVFCCSGTCCCCRPLNTCAQSQLIC